MSLTRFGRQWYSFSAGLEVGFHHPWHKRRELPGVLGLHSLRIVCFYCQRWMPKLCRWIKDFATSGRTKNETQGIRPPTRQRPRAPYITPLPHLASRINQCSSLSLLPNAVSFSCTLCQVWPELLWGVLWCSPRAWQLFGGFQSSTCNADI